MPEACPQPVDRGHYGVLVGWKHAAFNGKLILQLQTLSAEGEKASGGVETEHVVMTTQQAIVLANYLLKITDASPPPPRSGKFRRWFGG